MPSLRRYGLKYEDLTDDHYALMDMDFTQCSGQDLLQWYGHLLPLHIYTDVEYAPDAYIKKQFKHLVVQIVTAIEEDVNW